MKKIITVIILFALSVPVFANAALASECNAQTQTPATRSTTSGTRTTTTGPDPELKGNLTNPIKGVPSIACLFYRIVDLVMSFSYIVIAIFLILAGFKFVTAQGSQDKLVEAKKTFWYTIIGAVILIGAYTIIEVVQGLLTKLQAP